MSIPLSIYIHFPWCTRKCPYCDFNSHQQEGEVPEQQYIDTLIRDFDNELGGVQGRKINSIFMGGGTPSLFSAESIARLIQHLSSSVSFEEDIEITMEANPGSSDFSKFSGYRRAGVNRLSLGIQSFGQQQLNLLGRIHSSTEALDAVTAARQAGFDNINLDLMHGLPQQSAGLAIADLKQAIKLAPEHISWYQLTIEPNTVFYKQPPVLPNDDTLWQIYESGMALLAVHGYQRYEISAFARDKKFARHNLNYWEFGDYIGIGAGAHGKLTYDLLAEKPIGSRSLMKIFRRAKTRLPRDYMATGLERQSPGVRVTEIATADLPLEFLMNSLRLSRGFTEEKFNEATGLGFNHLQGFIRRAERAGLIIAEPGSITPTPRGLQFLNNLLMLVDDD